MVVGKLFFHDKQDNLSKFVCEMLNLVYKIVSVFLNLHVKFVSACIETNECMPNGLQMQKN